MLDPKNYPRSTHNDYYTDTATPIRNVGDLRKLIEGAPDDLPVWFFNLSMPTIFDLEGEIKTQQCLEHSGMIHERFGLILQVD